MCKILKVNHIGNKAILDCSAYEGDFSNAKVLKIINVNDGTTLEISDFILEKNRNCFSLNNNPWIAINGSTNADFIKEGNDIVLL